MRHLQGKALVVQLMVTVGLMFAFIGLANMIWNQNVSHTLPQLFGEAAASTIGRRAAHVAPVHHDRGRGRASRSACGSCCSAPGSASSMRAVVDNRDLAGLAGARSDRCSRASRGRSGARSPRWPASCSRPRRRHVDQRTAHAAHHHRVRGRGRRPPPQPAADLSRRADPRARDRSGRSRSSGSRTAGRTCADALPDDHAVHRAAAAAAGGAAVRAHRRGAAHRTGLDACATPRSAWSCSFVVMAIVSVFLSRDRTSTASRSACAPRSSRCRSCRSSAGPARSRSRRSRSRASARSRTRGSAARDGSIWAVFLAALVTMPVGALLAFPAMRLQGLYLALATLAFASMVEHVFFIAAVRGRTQQPVRSSRLHALRHRLRGTRTFLLLVTACSGSRGDRRRRAPAQRVRPAAGCAPRQRGRVGDRRRERARDQARRVHAVGRHGRLRRRVPRACTTRRSNAARQFPMLAGLPIVLALVIGGVGFVAGALFAGVFGLVLILIQENWHLSLWPCARVPRARARRARHHPEPVGRRRADRRGLRAAAAVAQGRARRSRRAARPRSPSPRSASSGSTRPFTEADVMLLDRALGISNDVPRAVGAGAARQLDRDGAVLDIDDVSVQFGGLLARRRRVARRSKRAASTGLIGPNGAGQDHAVQRHHRPAAADRRARSPRRRRRHAAKRRIDAPGSASPARSSGSRPFGSLTARENVLVALEMRRRWATERYDRVARRRRAARTGRDRARSPTRKVDVAARRDRAPRRARPRARHRAEGAAARRAVVGSRRGRDRRARRACCSSSPATASASCWSSTTCRS